MKISHHAILSASVTLLAFVTGISALQFGCGSSTKNVRVAPDLGKLAGTWLFPDGKLLVITPSTPLDKTKAPLLRISAWERIPASWEEYPLWTGEGSSADAVAVFVPFRHCDGIARLAYSSTALEVEVAWKSAESDAADCPTVADVTLQKASFEKLFAGQLADPEWVTAAIGNEASEDEQKRHQHVALLNRVAPLLTELAAEVDTPVKYDAVRQTKLALNSRYPLNNCLSNDNQQSCTEDSIRQVLADSLVPDGDLKLPPKPIAHTGIHDAGASLWMGNQYIISDTTNDATDDRTHFFGMLQLAPGQGDSETIDRLLATCPNLRVPESCPPDVLQQANKVLIDSRLKSKVLHFSSFLESGFVPFETYQPKNTPTSCIVENVAEVTGTFQCRGHNDRLLKVAKNADGSLFVRKIGTGWTTPEQIVFQALLGEESMEHTSTSWTGSSAYVLYPSVAADVVADYYHDMMTDAESTSSGEKSFTISLGEKSTGANGLLRLARDAISRAQFSVGTVSIEDILAIVSNVHAGLLLQCGITNFIDLTPQETCNKDKISNVVDGIVAEQLDKSMRLDLCGYDVSMNAEHATCPMITITAGKPTPASELLAALKHLRKLKSLSLRALGNRNKPGLDSFDPIKFAPQLEKLDLAGSGLTDIAIVRDLKELRVLDVSNNPIEDLSPISALKHLQKLNIASTDTRALPNMTNLSALQELDISYTAISDLKPLATARALTSLVISNSVAYDVTSEHLEEIIAAEITDPRNYKAKHAKRAEHLVPISLAPLSNLNKLEKLYISHSKISHLSVLARLSNLRNLSLISIGPLDLDLLTNLTALEHLYLGVHPTTNLGSLRSLFKLKSLILSGAKIGNLAALTGLRKLEAIHFVHVNELDWDSLGQIAGLRLLEISSSHGLDVTGIGKLQKLQELHMRYSTVTNLAAVCGAPTLKRLTLRDTNHDLSPLKRCTNLNVLIVDREMSAEAWELADHLPDVQIFTRP